MTEIPWTLALAAVILGLVVGYAIGADSREPLPRGRPMPYFPPEPPAVACAPPGSALPAKDIK